MLIPPPLPSLSSSTSFFPLSLLLFLPSLPPPSPIPHDQTYLLMEVCVLGSGDISSCVPTKKFHVSKDLFDWVGRGDQGGGEG